MRCAESLRVQAYFDAEVDAVCAAEIERHTEHCAQCRALLQDLENVRAALRRELAFTRAPPAFLAKIRGALDREEAAVRTTASGTAAGAVDAGARRPGERSSWRRAPRPFWAGALGGIGGTAIAAACVFFLLTPPPGNPLLDELLNAHIRSLMPAHLIDVVSSDKHTVKPWFAGHADVSPVVADFEPQGYRLIGGRADYLDRQRSAVVVYQHGAHIINVFSWAGNGRAKPANATRNGYYFAFWRSGNLEYCAVSDTAPEELMGLVRLLQE